ncbi:hypothetical protein IQ235_14810 [Oscillatoriales cyanobacterium LEGE 11467]|uniref:Uncharacterized protein n=1 Tax=Zarconia navalis LEGE 11467 TaxID=1828826 RepID=A0A928VXE4_9CYAN|nr:hypothetical protein [Zarconia navalis]MBE9042049.1 hypothetical protein [Zarconia navalis LEGE 11467]
MNTTDKHELERQLLAIVFSILDEFLNLYIVPFEVCFKLTVYGRSSSWLEPVINSSYLPDELGVLSRFE